MDAKVARRKKEFDRFVKMRDRARLVIDDELSFRRYQNSRWTK